MDGKKVVFFRWTGKPSLGEYEDIAKMLYGHDSEIECLVFSDEVSLQTEGDAVVDDVKVIGFSPDREYPYQDAADAYDLVLGCLYG